jgi:hypothetical protein
LWQPKLKLVGVRGFGPPASASQTLRANQLRYTPTVNAVYQSIKNMVNLMRYLGGQLSGKGYLSLSLRNPRKRGNERAARPAQKKNGPPAL